MKARTSLVGAALALACVTLVAGCGQTSPQSQAAELEPERQVWDVRTPTRAKVRHAFGAPAEARRLTDQINARQAAAMSELNR